MKKMVALGTFHITPPLREDGAVVASIARQHAGDKNANKQACLEKNKPNTKF